MEIPKSFRHEEKFQGPPIIIGLVGSARQARERVTLAFENLREGIASFSLSELRDSSGENFLVLLRRASQFLRTHDINRAVIELDETNPEEIELFRREVGTHIVKVDKQEAPTYLGKIDGIITIRKRHRNGRKEREWVGKVFAKIKDDVQRNDPMVTQT